MISSGCSGLLFPQVNFSTASNRARLGIQTISNPSKETFCKRMVPWQAFLNSPFRRISPVCAATLVRVKKPSPPSARRSGVPSWTSRAQTPPSHESFPLRWSLRLQLGLLLVSQCRDLPSWGAAALRPYERRRQNAERSPTTMLLFRSEEHVARWCRIWRSRSRHTRW